MDRTIFILSISSDIGRDLAQRYLQEGHRVVGTFRSKENLQDLENNDRCRLIPCDVSKKQSIARLVKKFKKLNQPWDVFISCVGDPRPLRAFFSAGFEEWSDSFKVNSIDQLRVLHGLYPFRNKKNISDVVFFAGIASNNVVPNFSAYGLAKIMLTKMCEFLDFENEDLNIFIVGPGKTRTKNHALILNDSHVSKEKYLETKDFLENQAGTSLEEIYECIEWLRREGKIVAGGRNFSVVYDPWRPNKRAALVKKLQSNFNMYKLRRGNNDFLQKKGNQMKVALSKSSNKISRRESIEDQRDLADFKERAKEPTVSYEKLLKKLSDTFERKV